MPSSAGFTIPALQRCSPICLLRTEIVHETGRHETGRNEALHVPWFSIGDATQQYANP